MDFREQIGDMARYTVATARTTPTYHEESRLLHDGYTLVAGLDEAGRGPLAGPVVAAAVILPPNPGGDWTAQVRDSKQMTAAQRERVLPYIQEAALQLEVGLSSPSEIDELGIVPATRLAMMRALGHMALLPQFLLVDALTLPEMDLPQRAIVHGDAFCLSIAAASVVAKVARDRMMREEDTTHPGYGFARHKGYGTREHLHNLSRLGPCAIHRMSFAPVSKVAGR